MRYQTAAAFRQALEERLRRQSLGHSQALTRLRKMVAFDRFLARLMSHDPHSWLIKGGFALQLRMVDRTRATKDVDAAVVEEWTAEQTIDRLRHAAALDLSDWFEFEVGDPSEVATGAPSGGLRFPIRCLVDGRGFESFHLDLGQGDPLSDPPELLTVPNLLDFAEIPATRVRCYPLTAQIAEKLHAYTRTYRGGASSRVRDFVDILLMASMQSFDGVKLRRAIHKTFQARGTHAMPNKLPDPPANLSGPYRKLARELNLGWPTLKKATVAAAHFLNAVLQDTPAKKWHPDERRWR